MAKARWGHANRSHASPNGWRVSRTAHSPSRCTRVGATTNRSVDAGVLKCSAAPSAVLKRTWPVAGSSANKVADDVSMAQTAPAEMIGEASSGLPVNHLISIDEEVTDKANNPSAQGTYTSEPDEAVPPHD